MVALTATTRPVPARIPTLTGGHPLFGHLFEMQRDPLALISRARDEVGDIARIPLGVRPAIAVSDPAAIERMLVDNARNYVKQTRGYAQLRRMVGNGLLTSEGSFWLRQRRIAQPAFHREKLAGLAALIERDTNEMLAGWSTGPAFDFSAEMMKLTMRIIGEALFSADVSGDADAAGAAVNELVHQAFARTMSVVNAPLFVPTPANRRFLRAKRTLDELVYGIIDARRAGEQRADLLSMLMETVDEDTGERMNDQQLRDEVLTLFSAGHETTSMLLSWTLHALLDNPEVEARLREELATSPARIDAVMRAPYLDAVIKESLRLYPPIWLIARCAVDDDVLGDFAVSRGQMIFASQWAVHRHPRLWKDPLRFDPSRFLVEDSLRPRYAYFPFIGGPRKCIGDQFALMEAKIILALVLRRHAFTRTPGHDVVTDPAVTLRMKDGLWVTAA